MAINTEEKVINTNKLKWDKVDKAKYKDLVEERLSDRNLLDVESDNINLVVEDLTDILLSTANQCAPQQKQKRSKCKSKGWNSDISQACRDSKTTFHKWKDSGRSVDPNKQTYVEMKRKKKVLRQIQRQLAAKHRYTLYNEIMSYAESPDSVNCNTEKKLFYKLIDNQRQSGKKKLSSLHIEDRHLTSNSEIREGWAKYFKSIANPEFPDNQSDKEYTTHIELNKHLIKEQCKNDNEDIIIPHDLVRTVLKQSKCGKAADIRGLQTEHIKFGGDALIEHVTKLTSRIINTCEIPNLFKHGLITPVYKGNDKPLDKPNSYRRITVASNLGRVIEKVHLELSKDDILPRQNPLQRGFTSKTSPSNGSLLLTEAISESIDKKQNLNAIFVDATQAFDKVWHDSMLVKLYDVGLSGRKWLFLNNWYEDLTSQVKWEGDVSSSFS